MRNRSLLEFIKHYWYLGILFIILIVVLVIGTQKEKPWSTNLDATETKSAVIKDKSADVESEASSAESEDSDSASRIDSDLFFLSDHEKENEELGSEEIEIEETDDLAETTFEEIDEVDGSTNGYDNTQTNRTSSYTPTYSNDSYSKPKRSNSATKNKSTTSTTSKPSAKTKTPVAEPEEIKESISTVESKPKQKPIETPTVEVDVDVEDSTESEQPVEPVAPEVIESEKPLEEDFLIDSSSIEE